jgi:hypothetical protein
MHVTQINVISNLDLHCSSLFIPFPVACTPASLQHFSNSSNLKPTHHTIQSNNTINNPHHQQHVQAIHLLELHGEPEASHHQHPSNGRQGISTSLPSNIILLIIAIQIDLKETAKYFGTTEGARQWQFRSIKKDAKVLQGKPGCEISGGGTPSRTKSTASTPKSKTPKKDALHSTSCHTWNIV